jgi:hypothetical protein
LSLQLWIDLKFETYVRQKTEQEARRFPRRSSQNHDLVDDNLIVVQNDCGANPFVYIDAYVVHGLLPLLFSSLQTKQETTFDEMVWPGDSGL